MSNFPEGASGDFASWQEAARLCSFDRPEFLEKVFAATTAVASGAATHMRDGRVFEDIEYSWPLLAGLMYGAAKIRGPLIALDFGGGLGVTYFQNRRFFDRLESVEWHVVERDVYCDFADRHLKHSRLHFHRSIEDCLSADVRPSVILFSSVLQFLSDPWSVLSSVRNLPVRHVLIDRCPISAENRDRLTIFRAPTGIVAEMTRPMWFFEESRLLAALGEDFDLIEQFSSFENSPDIPSQFTGYILERVRS
jgi:putative methyltransferase (TIGR04325 family)